MRSHADDDELAAYDRVIARLERAGDDESRDDLARALAEKARALHELGRHDEELATYNTLVARFADDPVPYICEVAAYGAVNAIVTLHELGRDEDVVAACIAFRERFDARPEPTLRGLIADRSAAALVHMGLALARLGRSDDALGVYARVLVEHGGATDVAVRAEVDDALERKAYLESSLGRSDAAIATFETFCRRLADAGDATDRDRYASARVRQAAEQVGDGQLRRALGTYRDLITWADPDTEPDALAAALHGAGQTLDALSTDVPDDAADGAIDAAIDAYDELLVRFGATESARIRRRVALALRAKDLLLMRAGRTAEGIVVASALIDRLDDADDGEELETLALALEDKGGMLAEEGRVDEALEVFEALLARCEAAGDPHFRLHAVIALVNKAGALGQLGRTDEAAAVQESVAADYGDEALVALDNVVRRLGTSAQPRIRKQAAGALYNKAAILVQLGRRDAALQVFSGLIERFCDSDDEAISGVVTMARESRALLERGDA